MRDYMDRRVTLPKRVTSPTWGPPTPCPKSLIPLKPEPISLHDDYTLKSPKNNVSPLCSQSLHIGAQQICEIILLLMFTFASRQDQVILIGLSL